jgi:S1-C subfamily serine protease
MKPRLLLLTSAVLLAVCVAARAEGPGDSVVKVYATVRKPDWQHPWRKGVAAEASGSGAVIDGRKILTNAHVVLYASEVYVQGRGGGDKVEAKIEAVGPGADLALLSVDDKGFFNNRPALRRTKLLPAERTSVEVFGYPIGGSDLSVTKGIISRIDYDYYGAYGKGDFGLRIQVDAAINPGNSGGPALAGKEMVGLAFSRLADYSAAFFSPNRLNPQNIGYLIPNEEIDLFLEDVADGRYDGKAWLYCYLQTLENPTLRKKLKLDSKVQGCMVRQAEGPLKKYDIVTHIGPYPLDNRGYVQVRENLRLSYHYAATKVMRQRKVPVTVLREGKVLKLEVPAFGKNDFLIKELQGEYPSYFVYGPLVFAPADLNTHYDYSEESPLSGRRRDKPRFPGEEVVVVTSPLLRNKVARGYADPVNKAVKSVNDTPVKNFRHLVEVLRDARDEYVSVEFFGKSPDLIVLPRRDMDKTTREVMDDNGITRRGTADAMAAWDGKKGAK